MEFERNVPRVRVDISGISLIGYGSPEGVPQKKIEMTENNLNHLYKKVWK
jgi:hypothetical protein